MDTGPFRQAIWYYIHGIKGIKHDDYHYRRVSSLCYIVIWIRVMDPMDVEPMFFRFKKTYFLFQLFVNSILKDNYIRNFVSENLRLQLTPLTP